MSCTFNENKKVSLPQVMDHHRAGGVKVWMKKATAKGKRFKYKKDSFDPKRDLK